MKFNLYVRKTEEQWGDAISNFVHTLTKTIFDVVGWCLMIGAIKYIGSKANSMALWYVENILLTLLYINIMAYFQNRFEFNILPPDSEHIKWKRWSNIVVSATLAAVAMFSANWFIGLLVTTVAEVQAATNG